jgi:hypothetical protein
MLRIGGRTRTLCIAILGHLSKVTSISTKYSTRPLWAIKLTHKNTTYKLTYWRSLSTYLSKYKGPSEEMETKSCLSMKWSERYLKFRIHLSYSVTCLRKEAMHPQNIHTIHLTNPDCLMTYTFIGVSHGLP